METKELYLKLQAAYPLGATCWSQADDGIRDLCQRARVLLGQTDALDFKAIQTPSRWNTEAVKRVMAYYEQMTTQQRAEYVHDNSWFWSDPDEDAVDSVEMVATISI